MTPSRLNFRLDAVAPGTRARAATFRPLHNEVQTPPFLPVGPQAPGKAQPTPTPGDAGPRPHPDPGRSGTAERAELAQDLEPEEDL